MSVGSVGAADEGFALRRRGIRQAQKSGVPTAGSGQQLIPQMRADAAQGPGGQALGADLLRGDRLQVQQGPSPLPQAPADGIGELGGVELLITAQTHQHRPWLALGAAGQKKQHLHCLAGLEAMGGAEGIQQMMAGMGGAGGMPGMPGMGGRRGRANPLGGRLK